jgi:hypothetical protein
LGLGKWRLDGPTDEALGYLTAVLEADPANTALYRRRALLYEERRDGRSALSDWNQALYQSGLRGNTLEIEAHIDWLSDVHIAAPENGTSLAGSVAIYGRAWSEEFQFYKLEYRPVDGDPDVWFSVAGTMGERVEDGLLGVWNVTAVAPGAYRLRLTVVLPDGNIAPWDEIDVRVRGE